MQELQGCWDQKDAGAKPWEERWGKRFTAGWGHVIILAPVPSADGRGFVAEDAHTKDQRC